MQLNLRIIFFQNQFMEKGKIIKRYKMLLEMQGRRQTCIFELTNFPYKADT